MNSSINKMPEIIENIFASGLISLSGNESEIQKILRNNILQFSFTDISKSYNQYTYRVKNLDNKKPDLVIKDDGDNVGIIEMKYQKSRERGATRFGRSVLDIFYLANEQKYNGIDGYLLYH